MHCRLRRRRRRPSVGITSVKSWDASLSVRPQSLHRPKTAPPPPPLRPENQYDDARTVTETVVIEPEGEYLKPVLPAPEEDRALYCEADDPEDREGNSGYLELIDNYQYYSNNY